MARTTSRSVAPRQRSPRRQLSTRAAPKSPPQPTGGVRRSPRFSSPRYTPELSPVPENLPAEPEWPPAFSEPAGYPPGHEQHPIVLDYDTGSETEVVMSSDEESDDDMDGPIRFIRAINDQHERAFRAINHMEYPTRYCLCLAEPSVVTMHTDWSCW